MATRIAAADPRVPGQVAAQGHPVVKTVIVPAEPAVRFVARQHPQAAPDSGVGLREVSPLAARSVCSADSLQGFDSGLVPVAP
jgi:hypothetical protein